MDFADVERLQHQGEWKHLGVVLAAAAQSLERGGADFIVLCTNTMHKLADAITEAVGIPLVHIVDSTAVAINKSNQKRVGLLATKFTMEEAFYAERMRDKFGIEVVVPSPPSRQLVHDVIYQELCHGLISERSREKYQEIIRELAQVGAESVILGCTEIELLISGEDSPLPTYPSTTTHAHAAVDFALGK